MIRIGLSGGRERGREGERRSECMKHPGYKRHAPTCMHALIHTHTCELRLFKDKAKKQTESPLFYFHRKKAAQVGLESTTSCFQGSRSTN